MIRFCWLTGVLLVCLSPTLGVANARPEVVIVHFGDSTCITSYLPESQRIEVVLNDRLSAFYKHQRMVSHNVAAGGDYGSSRLLRIRASDGTLVESLDYGRSISSCAPCIIAHGRMLSGDLGEDRIVVTLIAENSKADWPGPFGHPQKNQFALAEEPGATLVPMREVSPQAKSD